MLKKMEMSQGMNKKRSRTYRAKRMGREELEILKSRKKGIKKMKTCFRFQSSGSTRTFSARRISKKI